MTETAVWSFPMSIGLFAAAAVIIGVFGVLMTGLANRLAEATGMGQAIMGSVFVGGATSLPGIVTSVVAAGQGHAELAVSNALGGIAAQTFFLAVADVFYRKANLEHAAASAENLAMGSFLVTLLAVPLLGIATSDVAIWGVHPVTFVLIAAYAAGVRLLANARLAPMWYPRRTRETEQERAEAAPSRFTPAGRGLASLWIRFTIYAAAVGVAGWILAHAGISIVAHTGFSEGLVGGLFTAVTSSLPELVIAVTAVRMGALTLALGDILGGNAFDTLFIAFSDIAYRRGSIYAQLTEREVFWLALTLIMTGILLMGLIHREKHGFANIGLESALVTGLYLGGLAVLAWMG